MSLVTCDADRPLSSGEFQITDPDRADDVDRKQQQIARFLQSKQYDALLLQEAPNLAWFTSGGNFQGGQTGQTGTRAALLITADSRVVICNNVDSGELFDKELSGLGFLLKQRPWHEARHVLVDDLCRGRAVASDTGYSGTPNESGFLNSLRVSLEPVECGRLRQLGRLVAHAIEATARNIELGQTEAEIAGHLAHRLIKQQTTPLHLQVIADGKGRRYRHWSYDNVPMRKWCSISAVATRWGLCCGATRTVCFGNPPDELANSFQKTAMLLATGIFFSEAASSVSTVLNKVRRIYDKLGHAEEWELCDQAAITGYQVCEMPFVPDSEFVLGPRMAVHWHPALGSAAASDTLLVGNERAELITIHDQWPSVQVAVKGSAVTLPDMLRREQGDLHIPPP